MGIVMEQKSAENKSTDKLASACLEASIEASHRFVDQKAFTDKTSCYLSLLLLEYLALIVQMQNSSAIQRIKITQ